MNPPVSNLLSVLILLGAGTWSCTRSPNNDEADENPNVVSAVTIAHPVVSDIQETVTINAVSDFLVKTSIRSTISGYLKKVNARPGDAVTGGAVLFQLETKESHNLGNTLNKLDTTLHFGGTVAIKSPYTGYVRSVNYQPGEFVQEGDVLASLSDKRSFVFLLDVPYELTPYLRQNSEIDLHLPDGRVLRGQLGHPMPAVDSVSQTQRFLVHVPDAPTLPANLIATISLIKASHLHTVILPKATILSDEVQEHFWVMKVIDSSTAVRVNILKGLETLNRVEIDSPKLSPSDMILETGNYGLPDTARIVIRH